MNRYVLLEAGGEAAHSAYQFLMDAGIDDKSILAVDMNYSALVEWYEFYMVNIMEEKDYVLEDGDVIVPCDEYCRTRWDGDGFLCVKSSRNIHDKLLCHLALEDQIMYVKLPKLIKTDLVIRDRVAAGSRSLQIMEMSKDSDIIITERIHNKLEFVVDFCVYHDTFIAPRITHSMRYGGDTYCTLLGSENIHYSNLLDIVREVTTILHIHGIGNIQVIFDGNSYYLCEVATRFSGAAYLNLHIGYNPIAIMLNTPEATDVDVFDEKNVTTLYHKIRRL